MISYPKFLRGASLVCNAWFACSNLVCKSCLKYESVHKGMGWARTRTARARHFLLRKYMDRIGMAVYSPRKTRRFYELKLAASEYCT